MAQPASAGRDAERAAKEATRLLEVIRDLADELHPGATSAAPVTLDDALDRDLGFDSLGRMELLLRIERAFDLSMSEHDFATAETPRDLLRALAGAGGRHGAHAPPEVSEIALGEATVPHRAETLVEVLDWHVDAHPDRTHIHLYREDGEGDAVTYRDLKRAAERIAGGLQQVGVRSGESVAIMLPTGRDYFASFFGVLLAGGVPVPLYPPGRPTRIEEHLRRHADIVANSLAGVLITVPEAKRFGLLLRLRVQTLRTVATPNELTSASAGLAAPSPTAGDVAFLQYTSGSTGNPKGVVLTHGNLLANIRAMGAALEVEPTDVFVSWLPLYHDMGLIGAWLGTMHYAVPLVIMSPLSFLARPRRWLRAIHRYRGTMSAAPNFAYELCLKKVGDEDIRDLDLSSWRVAASGAEAVSPETVRHFCDRFRACGFRSEAMMPMYGLAESSVGLSFPPLGRGPLIDRIQRRPFTASGRAVPADETDADALRFVACGRPLPGHQIRVVDQANREVAERREGRLQFRGPSATGGYFRNADETRRLFRGDWLESGDLAYIADGDVYITGRTKDVIVRAGRNVYPAEIEETIGDLPGIRKGNVAVFGSIDADSGTERLVVLAETRKREAPALEELRAQINALATDLIDIPPDDVVLAPPNTVLKTSSGKIRRAASREVYEQGLTGKSRTAVRWQVTRLALAAAVPQMRRGLGVVASVLYGAYFWTLLGLLGCVAWPVIALLPPPSWRWIVMRSAARILMRAAGLTVAVEGLENLPPPAAACVFVSNHASYLDGPVLVATLPRRFAFVAKAELAPQIIAGIFLRRIGAEFVERFDKATGIADARRVSETAHRGRSLMFFPEGTIYRMPGLMPFHMGAFVSAVEAGIPVVPVAIRGTRSILRADTWLPRRAAITVVIDPPLEPGILETGPTAEPWSVALALRDAARRQILRRCREPDLAHERSQI